MRIGAYFLDSPIALLAEKLNSPLKIKQGEVLDGASAGIFYFKQYFNDSSTSGNCICMLPKVTLYVCSIPT